MRKCGRKLKKMSKNGRKRVKTCENERKRAKADENRRKSVKTYENVQKRKKSCVVMIVRIEMELQQMIQRGVKSKLLHITDQMGIGVDATKVLWAPYILIQAAKMSSENGVNPPAPNPSHNSSFSLLSVLGRERLTGPNYMDWMRNLRFTLRYENKEYVLDEQIPTINDNSTQDEIEAHQKHYDDANKVSCIMASSMSPELQKTFEFTWAYEMNQQLKEMFQAKASKERLDVVKSLMACKPKPGASICAFVLEMKGYFDRLESLNMVFDAELSINIILSGLPADYNQFVLSYQMNGKETSIMELIAYYHNDEQGIKTIDVPLFSRSCVNVGHNAKKKKDFSFKTWKGITGAK
ncbi:hypothetical protein Tco_1055747 [Tanacetum coccineum]|uniref:Uncharacterized protein n=1 Tax=Tanacetum coccineum TaxID=301880 RepID=A0ABQ5H1Y7_9ASTR